MGRVTDLAVNEGDFVKKGQFLLQSTRGTSRPPSSAARPALRAEAQIEQFRVAIATARENLALSRRRSSGQRDSGRSS